MTFELLRTIAMICAVNSGADNPKLIRYAQLVQMECQAKVIKCSMDQAIKYKVQNINASHVAACLTGLDNG